MSQDYPERFEYVRENVETKETSDSEQLSELEAYRANRYLIETSAPYRWVRA